MAEEKLTKSDREFIEDGLAKEWAAYVQQYGFGPEEAGNPHALTSFIGERHPDVVPSFLAYAKACGKSFQMRLTRAVARYLLSPEATQADVLKNLSERCVPDPVVRMSLKEWTRTNLSGVSDAHVQRVVESLWNEDGKDGDAGARTYFRLLSPIEHAAGAATRKREFALASAQAAKALRRYCKSAWSAPLPPIRNRVDLALVLMRIHATLLDRARERVKKREDLERREADIKHREAELRDEHTAALAESITNASAVARKLREEVEAGKAGTAAWATENSAELKETLRIFERYTEISSDKDAPKTAADARQFIAQLSPVLADIEDAFAEGLMPLAESIETREDVERIIGWIPDFFARTDTSLAEGLPTSGRNVAIRRSAASRLRQLVRGRLAEFDDAADIIRNPPDNISSLQLTLAGYTSLTAACGKAGKKHAVEYDALRRARVFDIPTDLLTRLVADAASYVTESYPNDMSRTERKARLHAAASQMPVPDNLPFDVCYFGLGSGAVFTEKGHAMPERAVIGLLVTMDGMLFENVANLTANVWGMTTTFDLDQGGWAATADQLSHEFWPWVLPALLEVIDDQACVTVEPGRSKKFNRDYKGTALGKDRKKIPPPYYEVKLRRGATFAAETKRAVERQYRPPSYRFDVRSHFRVLLKRGKLPLDDKTRAVLVRRSYEIFEDVVSSECAGAMRERGQKPKQPDEWIAYRRLRVKASVNGPEGAPYVPSIRTVEAG